MHFEIVVEDLSGMRALQILVPKILGDAPHTFLVHAYKGLGHIPPKMRDPKDAAKRLLLDNLPKLLKGHGRTFAGRQNYPAAVIVVCDLDDKCLKEFRAELSSILAACNPKPETRFCIAIEEGEAWFLGDLAAVKKAYPKAKDRVLKSYTNDSICGTWEKLAEAIYPGGAAALLSRGGPAVGIEKSKWAEAISPHMTIAENRSPSFSYFRDKLKELAGSQDKS